MDDKSPIDRTILMPILIGVLSILGILIMLLIGRMSASRASIAAEPTETPFEYIFLGTEPVPSVEITAATEEELFTVTPFESVFDTPTPGLPLITGTPATPTRGTPNLTSGPLGTQIIGTPIGTSIGITPLVTITSGPPTSTSASGPPLNPGTYDDVDSHLVYDGSWASQTGVAEAYQGTLHVSTVPTSSVTFRFIGTQVRILYLAASSLGEVAITIDNNPNLSFTVDQSDLQSGNEWASPPLSNATHTVILSHNSGGSVNIDEVIIPSVPATGTVTPTPTRTPTP